MCFGRAFLTHVCASALEWFLAYAVPEIPALVCIAVSLVLGVVLVETAVTLWHRGTGPHAGE
jgi:hypothetical protein